MRPNPKKKLGQLSWRVATAEVELFVTQTGGHLGPVTYRTGGKKITPLSVAPWAEEKVHDGLPALLKVLRGDFFCLPFGANTTPFRGERHGLHGETANGQWRCEAMQNHTLHLSLKTKVRRGRVDKYVRLRPGHLAVYERHVIRGMTGPMSFGHHAMLKFPEKEGSGRISTSRFAHGEITPSAQEHPANGGYSALRTGGKLSTLERAPLQGGGYTDLSIYPARRGFEDFVLLASDQRLPFAWTAVAFPEEGYVWFALKDPRVLRQTMLWISNGGRHYAPWNGRHRNVMGLEEVTTYWGGLHESARPNAFTKKGLRTCHLFRADKPVTVNYIMAVATIPKNFDKVANIKSKANRTRVELVSQSGVCIGAAVDLGFLTTQGAIV